MVAKGVLWEVCVGGMAGLRVRPARPEGHIPHLLYLSFVRHQRREERYTRVAHGGRFLRPASDTP